MNTPSVYPLSVGEQRYLDRLCGDCATSEQALFGDSLSFKDVLDVINPLQQLPIIGDIYRAISGDTISAGARIAGGFLLGGPLGLVASAANAGLESATGSDLGQHLYAMLGGSSGTKLASAAYQKTAALSPA